MAETNTSGQIAIKYRQAIQVLVQQTPSKTDYVFIPKGGVSMAWINLEDYGDVIGRYKVCCGGHKRQSFIEANEQDIRIWTNGGGR
jgi:hypothetical protein